jgi:hypothetical protein
MEQRVLEKRVRVCTSESSMMAVKVVKKMRAEVTAMMPAPAPQTSQSFDTQARVELDCRHAPIMSHLAGIDRLRAASLVAAAIPAVSSGAVGCSAVQSTTATTPPDLQNKPDRTHQK